MSARYRAFRFLHPDLDQEQGASGLTLSSGGSISMVTEEASVRQAVLLLLSTRPGERIMRPSYGCNLRQLLFAPNDLTTAGLAIHYVRQALERWEPRVKLLAVDAEPNRNHPSRLDIRLSYQVRATGRTQELSYPLQLAGEMS